MQKQDIKLDETDCLELESLLLKSSLTVKFHKRIQVLLKLNSGKSYSEVSKEVGMTYIAELFVINTLIKAKNNPHLNIYQTSLAEIDGLQRAKITALACSESPASESPAGHAEWSLCLLAEKVIELGYCEHISHNHVGVILKKNDVKPHLKVYWCIGKIDALFLSRMERGRPCGYFRFIRIAL